MLVCGGAGFVGSHLVRRAIAHGCPVFVADRATAPWERLDDCAGQFERISVDLLDTAAVKDVFEHSQPKIVVNCAAYGVDYAQQDPVLAVRINVEVPAILYGAARQANRFVHIGSAYEYGSSDTPIDEAHPCNPTTLYGTTKAAGSLVLRNRASAGGPLLGIVRPFGIWGPGEGDHKLVPQVVNACLARIPLDLTTCDIVRDYTYVVDMVDMILTYAFHPEFNAIPILNIGTGPRLLRDFITEAARVLDGEDLMRFGSKPHRPDEMQFVAANTTLLNSLLPNAKRTPVEHGVTAMAAPGSTP